MLDDATDSSVAEQELVYIQMTTEGQESVIILTVAAVERATTVDIHATVMDATAHSWVTTSEALMSNVALRVQVPYNGLKRWCCLIDEGSAKSAGIHCLAHTRAGSEEHREED